MPKNLRMVEEELAADPRLRLVAVVSEMFAWERESLRGSNRAAWCRKTFDRLQKDDWRDGKHMGDCTGEPNTCYRCLVEEMVDDARKTLKAYDQEFGTALGVEFKEV